MDNAPPITVVIADDNEEIRDFLAFFLGRESDLQVVGRAANGEQALSLIQSLEPDVVLMDVEMPGVNGVSATLQVRSQAPATRVIGMSILDHTEAMLSAGAAAFVTKDNLYRDAKRLIRRLGRHDDPVG